MFCAMLAACLCIVPFSAAQAQNNVAIIDLAYIFKHHKRFQGETETMKRDVKARETYFKGQRDQMIKLSEEIKQFKPGTPDYKRREADLTQRQAKLQADLQLQKKEFVEREAAMYYRTYREIVDEVRLHSERNNVSLVLRFNGEAMDGSNPKGVMKQLNKAVIYHNRSIDITPIILHNLNKRAQPANISNRPGGPLPGGQFRPRR